MPLDGHSFLLSQGWSGKDTGLRQGAITRPITIAQKNNLGGLGKDRDEAYPFWDHLFTAASKAITVKIDDSDESDNESTPPPVPILNRTSTGILSNRRPVDQSSTSTTCSSTSKPSSSAGPRLSLLAHAKREAAKRHLYSKFYRGIIIAPDPDISQQPMVPTSAIHSEPSSISTCQPSLNNEEDVNKRKWKPSSDDTGEDAERQERKRLKREKKVRKESKKKEREQRRELKAKVKLEKQARREKKEQKKALEGKEVVGDGQSLDKEDCERLKRKRKEQRQVQDRKISPTSK